MTTYTDEVNIYNPEAVGEGIDGAAQTATNYIQADETGIRIANANPSTATTYQHQTATETEFVVNGVSVAEFGGEGGRVGAADAGHLTLTEDSVTITNADGVQAFNVDLDSGVAYSYATEPVEPLQANTFRATQAGITLTHSRVTDVSRAVSGSTIKSDTGQVFQMQKNYTDSEYFNTNYATVSSGMSVSGHNTRKLTVEIMTIRNATAGTSKTVTHSASGIRWGTDSKRTLDVVATWAYDAAAGTLTDTVAVTFKAETTLIYTVDYHRRTLRKMQYYTASTAPAFSLGTRALDSTIGAFSAIVGEDLHATQPNQVAIGKHNVEDTNGDYALIIGNGTDDANRSNAFAVTWDGDIVAPLQQANWTPKSTYTDSVITFRRFGHVVFATGAVTIKRAISTRTAVATIPDGYRPVAESYGTGTNGEKIVMRADGNFNFDSANASTHYFSVMYMAG